MNAARPFRLADALVNRRASIVPQLGSPSEGCGRHERKTPSAHPPLSGRRYYWNRRNSEEKKSSLTSSIDPLDRSLRGPFRAADSTYASDYEAMPAREAYPELKSGFESPEMMALSRSRLVAGMIKPQTSGWQAA